MRRIIMVNVPFRGDLAGAAEQSLSNNAANRNLQACDSPSQRESLPSPALKASEWLVTPQTPVYRRAHCRTSLNRIVRFSRLSAGEFGMASALNDPSGEPFADTAPAHPDEAGYRPSAGEAFMNARQLDYFREKLANWKESILRESQGTLATLQSESLREPDVNDRASSETDWSLELRTRDRQRKLIAKIDAALRRIEDGEYGYCEVTGEPISLGRLEARPIATMTVEAQERHERQEKISRDE
jgi:DnaK suppressor protein